MSFSSMGVAVFQFPSFQSRSVPMLEEVGQKTTRKKKTGILYRFQFRATSYRTRRMSNMPWMRETPLPDFSSEALGQPPWWDWSGNGSAPHERGCLRRPSSLCRFSFLGSLFPYFIFMTSFFLAFSQQSVGIRSVGPTRSELSGMPRADETHAGSQRRLDTVDMSGPTNLNITQQRFSRAVPGWHNGAS